MSRIVIIIALVFLLSESATSQSFPSLACQNALDDIAIVCDSDDGSGATTIYALGFVEMPIKPFSAYVHPRYVYSQGSACVQFC